jgi:hypothetical protein
LANYHLLGPPEVCLVYFWPQEYSKEQTLTLSLWRGSRQVLGWRQCHCPPNLLLSSHWTVTSPFILESCFGTFTYNLYGASSGPWWQL